MIHSESFRVVNWFLWPESSGISSGPHTHAHAHTPTYCTCMLTVMTQQNDNSSGWFRLVWWINAGCKSSQIRDNQIFFCFFFSKWLNYAEEENEIIHTQPVCGSQMFRFCTSRCDWWVKLPGEQQREHSPEGQTCSGLPTPSRIPEFQFDQTPPNNSCSCLMTVDMRSGKANPNTQE